MKSMEKIKKISITTAAICGIILSTHSHSSISGTNKKVQGSLLYTPAINPILEK